MKLIASLPLVLASLLLAGCCNCPGVRPVDYNVKTDPMAKVVADINANNSKIPTLWAHHYYEADIVDEKGHKHHVAGDGVLLYKAPDCLRLVGSAVVGTVFDIGSNPETFWLKLGPEAGNTMWWGRYSDFARMNPDNAVIPIRPDMVLDVLGISTINTNFNALPAPTMRFNAEEDAYVFIWNGKLPDRWVALREVWYDRASKRPRRMMVYDMNGRVILQATLNQSQFRPVPVAGLPREQWPWIPGDYKLFFPETGSRLGFTLDEATLTRKEGPLTIPIARSFRMPNPEAAGVDHVIQIGKDAGQ